MSISTTSDGWFWKCWRASSPVAASATSQPSSSRARRTAVRMRSSSSTARIRVLMDETLRDSVRGCEPPGIGLGVRGEEGGAAGTSAGAVVQAVGQVAADRPAPHEGGGAVLGPRLERGEVDVDPLRARWRAPPRRRRPGPRPASASRRLGELEDHGPRLGADGHGVAPGGDGRHGRAGWRARSAFRCRSLCDPMTSRRAGTGDQAGADVGGGEQVEQGAGDARARRPAPSRPGAGRPSRSVTTAPASVATRPPAARSQRARPRS